MTDNAQDGSGAASTSTTVAQAPVAPVVQQQPSIVVDTSLWQVVDPDVAKENPVEDKHRRLVRSHRSSPYDRELKPNAKIRDELSVSCSTIVVKPRELKHGCRRFSITRPVSLSRPKKRILYGSSASTSQETSAA